MKIHLVITILLITILSGCNSENSSGKYFFYSSPSFHEGFDIELDLKNRRISAKENYQYFFADSLSPTLFRMIDSLDARSVKNFLPKGSNITVEISDSEYEKLKINLDKLLDYKLSEREKIPPNDGITIFVEDSVGNKNIRRNTFYSPSKKTKQGKIIIETYKILIDIFKNKTVIEESIENSERYFDDKLIKVKSRNPLYVKVLENRDENCESLEYEIKQLPNSKTIFLDLTNFDGDKKCIEKVFRKKYSKIKWISKDSPFAEP
ncbi:hypothetical protein FNO01nite_34450 [Flavobacterium noncentrifugens]|uniref:Lipoprotein n=1 Tax=Flavobacterium noncentrifugens TaxID=1128970 RepID=A0A1G9C307_9FLAO|nr:hypothetical protein [Flavobacterium noncentrifugens]GEP52773.1 hypothetical protein FNO01nite_34450 [Flavobacterium noncentrifugens]SDK45675.1 hypothetical protein SAMN04487935_3444 [Flavobacterium noncentrifugens]